MAQVKNPSWSQAREAARLLKGKISEQTSITAKKLRGINCRVAVNRQGQVLAIAYALLVDEKYLTVTLYLFKEEIQVESIGRRLIYNLITTDQVEKIKLEEGTQYLGTQYALY